MSTLPGASLLAAAVELALNSAVSGSSAAARDLAALDGKVVRLEVRDLPLTLHFLPQDGRLTVAAGYHGQADITVQAPTLALLETAFRRGEAVPRGIEIRGDAETAQLFSRLLKQADLDWEELLSRYVGDVAAHQFGNAARGLLRWGRDVASRLGLDLADYLRYEARHVPPRHEVEAFIAEVDRTRDDVERLAARVERFARRSGVA